MYICSPITNMLFRIIIQIKTYVTDFICSITVINNFTICSCYDGMLFDMWAIWVFASFLREQSLFWLSNYNFVHGCYCSRLLDKYCPTSCNSNSILTMLCELVPLFFVINEIIENMPLFLRGSTQLVTELIFNYNNYTNVFT